MRVATYALAFSIALPQKVSSVIMGIWLVLFLVYNCKNKVRIELTSVKIPVLIAISITVLRFLSLTYSDDPAAAFSHFFKAPFSFLALPVCALWGMSFARFDKIIKWFIAGNFAHITIFLGIFIIKFCWSDSLDLGFTPSVASFEIVFSEVTHRTLAGINSIIAMAGILALHKKKAIVKSEYFFYAFYILSALAYLYVRDSRIIQVAFFAVLGLYSFFATKNSIRKYITIVVFFLVATVAVTVVPSRLTTTLTNLTKSERFVDESRSNIWMSSLSTVKDSPWFGYGFHSYQDNLTEKYRSFGFEHLKDNEFSAHCVFVTSWLETGVLGFVVAVLLLCSLFYFTRESGKKLFYWLAGSVFLLVFLTDDYIYMYNGALTFSFLLLALTSSDCMEVEQDSKPERFLRLSIISLTIIFFCWIIYLFKSESRSGVRLVNCFLSEKEKKDFPIDIINMDVVFIGDKKRIKSKALTDNGYYYVTLSRYNLNEEPSGTCLELDCYVSSEFNGELAYLQDILERQQFFYDVSSVEYDSLGNVLSKEYFMNSNDVNMYSYADLKVRDRWQTLRVPLVTGERTIMSYVFLGDVSPDSLEGYVVLANPRIAVKGN